MHGNAPHAGSSDDESTPESRRALRRDLVNVASTTRALLSDDFVVGTEIAGDNGGLQARIAVQPPVGSVISAGFEHEDDDFDTAEALAQELAAGAVLEAKHATQELSRTAR